jgi:hypothetical protein
VGDVLWVVMGTIALVMFIACANVTNLLLVRAEARQHELALRAALGAGVARIIRGLLVESVMLGVMGGAFGVVVAYAGLRLLVAIGPANLPRLNEISLDLRTCGFTLMLSVLSGLFLGLVPAFRYAGPRISVALRGAGRTASVSRERHRARNVLVVAQVGYHTGAASEPKADDPHGAGVANRRAGVHRRGASSNRAHLDSVFARSGAQACHKNPKQSGRQAEHDSRGDVRWICERGTDGGGASQLGQCVSGRQGVPRQRCALTAVRECFSRVPTHDWRPADGRSRTDVE